VGTLLPAINVYDRRDVDELILLDISATPEGRGPDVETVRDASAECSVPLTVGGGVRTLDDVRALLRAGADKVCINSAAYANPELVSAAAQAFGSQCVVVGIDCRSARDSTCYSHCGTRAEGVTAVEWARRVEALGAGEILVTSIERDGTMLGYDIDLLSDVVRAVSIPVVASGGAGSYDDIFRALHDASASAAAAASIYHFTELTPLGAKRFLAERGVPVRLDSTSSTR
jgi:cyclase